MTNKSNVVSSRSFCGRCLFNIRPVDSPHGRCNNVAKIVRGVKTHTIDGCTDGFKLNGGTIREEQPVQAPGPIVPVHTDDY